MPNLTDNIKNLDFDLGSFIDTSEAAEFIANVPGIQDLILAGSTIFDSIKSFIVEVKKLLDQLLEWFDFSGFFDSLGISDLLKSIFDWVQENLSPLGFNAYTRELMRGLFNDTCSIFNSSLRNSFGNTNLTLQSFSLMGLLIAMLCNGIDGAYSSLMSMFKSKDSLSKEEIAVMSQEDKDAYNITRAKHDDKVDTLFSKTLLPVFNKMAGKSRIGILDDMNTQTSMLTKGGNSSQNMGKMLLKGIDGIDHQGKSPDDTLTSINKTLGIVEPGIFGIGSNIDISTAKNSKEYTKLATKVVKKKVPTLSTAVSTPDLNTFMTLI